jgi:RNA polymerase sigma-70 factor (ECF subfamily)
MLFHMIKKNSSGESLIIQSLNQGCERAMRYLYEKYSCRIYFMAMKFLKSPEQSQELVQDVFLKLWANRMELDKDRPIEAWLYSVARNQAINEFKKTAREQLRRSTLLVGEVHLSASEEADGRILEKETNHLLREAIRQLPDKQREVYTLARLEGFSRLEIADQMQISALTVKTHMSRAADSVKNYVHNKGLSAGCQLLLASFGLQFL